MTDFPTTDLSHCPACHAAQLSPGGFAYDYRDTLFPAKRCDTCRLLFLARQPTQRGLEILYGADYFDSDYHCGHEDASYYESAEAQRASADVLLQRIEQHVSPGTMLEIGCAGGYFLDTARQRGWQVRGIEVSDSAARFARELGIEVHVGTIETAELEPESFDAVYLGDVLEHVPDPLGTVRRIHDALRPGGVVMVAGPITINSIDRRIGLALYRALGKTKVLRHPPYHLLEFTPDSLAATLRRGGLDVVWVQQNKIPPDVKNARRRSSAEHAAKLVLDTVNWWLTRISGRLGDRAVVIARRSA